MPGLRSKDRTAHSRPGRRFIEVDQAEHLAAKRMFKGREQNGFPCHFARDASLAACRLGHIEHATLQSDQRAVRSASSANLRIVFSLEMGDGNRRHNAHMKDHLLRSSIFLASFA